MDSNRDDPSKLNAKLEQNLALAESYYKTKFIPAIADVKSSIAAELTVLRSTLSTTDSASEDHAFIKKTITDYENISKMIDLYASSAELMMKKLREDIIFNEFTVTDKVINDIKEKTSDFSAKFKLLFNPKLSKYFNELADKHEQIISRLQEIDQKKEVQEVVNRLIEGYKSVTELTTQLSLKSEFAQLPRAKLSSSVGSQHSTLFSGLQQTTANTSNNNDKDAKSDAKKDTNLDTGNKM